MRVLDNCIIPSNSVLQYIYVKQEQRDVGSIESHQGTVNFAELMERDNG